MSGDTLKSGKHPKTFAGATSPLAQKLCPDEANQAMLEEVEGPNGDGTPAVVFYSTNRRFDF